MGRIVRDGVLIAGGREICDVRARLAEQGLRAPSRVCDAASQADLEAIVATASREERLLWAGSAGLADAVAASLAASRTEPPAVMPSRPARDGRVILFVGSQHEVTQGQRQRLLTARDVMISSEPRDALKRTDARHVLVPPRCSEVQLDADSCARIAGFVMTGGDTAADVCRCVLGATRLQLGGEVEQGVPWGVLRGGIADGLPMVLKSGGFGTPDTLVAALDFLDARNAGR
jgi:uncharacterized protein YgbK (DUF1537 family)